MIGQVGELRKHGEEWVAGLSGAVEVVELGRDVVADASDVLQVEGGLQGRTARVVGVHDFDGGRRQVEVGPEGRQV